MIENVEALTDSYENRIGGDGTTWVVHYIGREMTQQEKDELKSEAYYVYHGLPNPYRFGFVDLNWSSSEYFFNNTMQRWKSIGRCSSDKKLIGSTTNVLCWANYFSFN